jgi:hypothetical protein
VVTCCITRNAAPSFLTTSLMRVGDYGEVSAHR